MTSKDSLNFTKRTLFSTAATSTRCMSLYPSGKGGKPQRLVVGDQSGICTSFTLDEKLEAKVAFNTSEASPKKGSAPPKPVRCLYLFGDQLFFLKGDILEAFSRKGKHFFSANTNVTEAIHSVYIDTPYIFLGGDFMLTCMKETKELGFYMCPDRVHHMISYIVASSATKTDRTLDDYVSCLACNDRAIRLVSNNKLLEEYNCEAPVTALCLYEEPKDKVRYLFYGTQVGSVGTYLVQPNNSLRRCGNYVPPGDAQSTISAMSTFDVDKDKNDELLVGYEDGSIRVLRVVFSDPLNLSFEVLWSTNIGEKIMSIGGGIVTTGASQPDIVVHLYSGPVVCFTLQQEEVKSPSAKRTGPSQLQLMSAKKADMEKEISTLKANINDKVKELAVISGAMERQAPVVAVASLFKASVSLRPLDNKPILSLIINSDVPLEYCIVRSSIETTFTGTDSCNVVHNAVAPNAKTKSLALVHPVQDGPSQVGGKRLEVRLWADEGRADSLSLTLYALPKPRTAQSKTIQLTALPLYARVSSVSHLMTPNEAPFVLSQITFTGSFPKTDVHLWLTSLLPGMENFHQVSPTMYFASEYLSSVLIVEMQVDESTEETTLSFTSDSITALWSVKNVVSVLAGERQRELRSKENLLFGSVDRRLRKILPVIEQCASAKERVLLLEGLRELQSSENDISFLPNHLKSLLESQENVISSAELQKEHLKYIKRAVITLYKCASELLRHTPTLTPGLKAELETISSGEDFDPKRLEAIFFPKNEHVLEHERLEKELQNDAQQQTNTQILVQNIDTQAAQLLDEDGKDQLSVSQPSQLVSSLSDEEMEANREL